MTNDDEELAQQMHNILRKHRIFAPDEAWCLCPSEYRQRMIRAAKDARQQLTIDEHGVSLEERLSIAWNAGCERGKELALEDISNSSDRGYQDGYREGYAFGVRKYGGRS